MLTIHIPLRTNRYICLPGEMVTTYMFSMEHRRLLDDWKQTGINFGFLHEPRHGQRGNIGSIMKIISILGVRRWGIIEIQIECIDLFRLVEYHNKFGEKLYPGGIVNIIDRRTHPVASREIYALMADYMNCYNDMWWAKNFDPNTKYDIYEVARLVKVDYEEKERLLKTDDYRKKEEIVKYRINLELAFAKQSKSRFDKLNWN